jgi:hypothetical protein
MVHLQRVTVVGAVMLGGCPSSPREVDPVEKTEDEEPVPEAVAIPVDAPEQSDEGAPAEPVTASLADLVADAALIYNRGELLCSDAQCSADAGWATCDYYTPKASTLEMGLALRNVPPAATARLEERRLDLDVSAAEVKAVRKWLDKPLRPIGAIEGNFGAGVDRILVFAPKQDRPFREFDYVEPLDHDVAVLLSGSEPKGILPFGRVWGLEVIKVVDLDGDGTQELVWVSQPAHEELGTYISISYVRGSELAIQELGYCAYNGCDAFLPAEKCGHSFVKWTKERIKERIKAKGR